MFEVTNSSTQQNKFLGKFPKIFRDIYFRCEYINLYLQKKTDEMMAALYETSDGGLIFYNFIRSPIDQDLIEGNKIYYDLSSCYGYSGPITYRCSTSDVMRFESLFLQWCEKNNIVAEFIRFHPLYENQNLFQKNIQIEKNRVTVIVDLTSESIEKIWMNQIDSKNRNQIRKAIKSGVVIEESHELEEFIKIYTMTMKRLHSDSFYLFEEEYYKKLGQWNPEDYFVLYAYYQEKIIAGAIFFVSGDYMHYHLSGSLKEYQHLCANNLMLFRAIEIGINKGCSKLHLGGGRGQEEEDGLFRFKKSFSKDRGTFFVGKRIHNQQRYRELIRAWEERNQHKAEKFLQYREGVI